LSNKRFQTLAPILAFLIPFAVRLLPEIIAWPYPIGFDTVYAYVPWIKSGYPINLGPLEFFRGARLFPLLALMLDRYVLNNPVITIKLLGPLLYAFLGLSLYLFSKNVLKWGPRKSLLLVGICSIYFISLRISWEMYRQMLGTIFLFSALTCYWSSKRRLGFILTPVFSLLAAFSHEIVAVALLIILLVETIIGSLTRSEKLPAVAFSLILLFAFLGFILFDPAAKVLRIPFESFSEDRALLAGHIFGFIAYSYCPLAPFALYGLVKLRNRLVYCWLASMLLLSTWPVICPEVAPPLWFRWAIFMVYPVSILFIEGVHRIFSHSPPKVIKVILTLYLSFIVFTGVWYLVADPEHAFMYYSDYNPYKAYVQSSMLQSTIPIEDIEPSTQAIKWLSENANGLVIFHEAFYPWAIICDCLPEKYIVIRERNLSKPKRPSFADALNEIIEKAKNDKSQIYTVWWASSKGWYNVLQLPANFKLEKSFGNIGIYKAEIK